MTASYHMQKKTYLLKLLIIWDNQHYLSIRIEKNWSTTSDKWLPRRFCYINKWLFLFCIFQQEVLHLRRRVRYLSVASVSVFCFHTLRSFSPADIRLIDLKDRIALLWLEDVSFCWSSPAPHPSLSTLPFIHHFPIFFLTPVYKSELRLQVCVSFLL